MNQSALEILGSPSAEETKKINIFRIPALVHCGLSEQLKKCIVDNVHGIFEMDYESKWGKRAYIRLHIKPFTGCCNSIGAQLIIDDITEQKHMEEELRILSSTDPLTSVYNRRYFIEKLEEECHRVQKQGWGTFSVALLDIDHFKSINDCFGHHEANPVHHLSGAGIPNHRRHHLSDPDAGYFQASEHSGEEVERKWLNR